MHALFGRAGLFGRAERSVRLAALGALERLTALPNDGAPPRDPRRILLLRIDRIGDMIVSTPAIRAIRKRFPEAELRVIASRANAAILENNPDVDGVHVYGRSSGLLGLLRSPWDVAADLSAGPSVTAGLLARLARARVRVSFEKDRGACFYNARLPFDERAHQAREMMKIAAWLGAGSEDLRYSVYPGPEHEREAEQALRAAGWRPGASWVALHPGNIKKFDNRWPEEKFGALCGRLEASGKARPLLLQGHDEAPLIDAVRRACPAPVAALPPLGLLATACALKRMRAVVCNSTSTMHLALAVEAKTVCLLSAYSAACWGALEPGHRQLVSRQWNSCRDIPVEDAWAALEELL